MATIYNQLTLDERYQIQALNKLSFSAREIARRLNRSNKTISKEFCHSSTGTYCAKSGASQSRSNEANSHQKA